MESKSNEEMPDEENCERHELIRGFGSFTTRPLKSRDIDQIRDLVRRVFPFTYPDSFYREVTSSRYWAKGVFERGDELIALVVASVEEHESSPNTGGLPSGSLKGNQFHYYLSILGVEHSYRRFKLSTHLVNKCIKMVAERGGSGLYLHVMAENIPARNLYKKLGFETYGFYPDFYRPWAGDGFGEVIMIPDKRNPPIIKI